MIKQDHISKGSGEYKCCGIGDIMLLVCEVNSQDHVIKESSDFIGRIP